MPSQPSRQACSKAKRSVLLKLRVANRSQDRTIFGPGSPGATQSLRFGCWHGLFTEQVGSILKHFRRRGMRKGRTTVSLGSEPQDGAARFEMTSEPQIGSGKNLTARLPEVELAVILCRVIESIEHHPAQLRNAVYELARIKLRKEVCRTHPPISSLEVRRLTLALESAIESVETIYSRHDELRSLHSLHRLIESSEIGWSEEIIKPREPLLIIDQPAAQTAEANHRPKGASLIVERLLHWPSVAPLLRGAMVAIFALALGVVLSHFGQIGRLAAPPSPSQPESAPMAPPAIARIQDAFSHRRFVDAGAPAVVGGNALSYSGHHDPSTVVPDEQPVTPPGPSRCTQTYKVPSEGGGQASINIVRC